LSGLLKNPGPLGLHPQKPLVDDAPIIDISNVALASPPNYKIGEQVATRLAYGTALAKVCMFFYFFNIFNKYIIKAYLLIV